MLGERSSEQVLFRPLAALEGLHERAGTHDGNAIADRHELAKIARYDQERLARGRKRIELFVDIGSGADIDAPRRLVKQQNPAVAMQPARKQHLLLVAAAQLVDRLHSAARANR